LNGYRAIAVQRYTLTGHDDPQVRQQRGSTTYV
jgi:hypothetical protein